MNQAVQAASRIRLLGGSVDAVTARGVLRFAGECIRNGRKGIVANHNLHSLALSRSDRLMRVFYAMADVIQIDSTPLIAWGRILGAPLSRDHRCTYLDWRDDFWRRAQASGWRVFYLGGTPGVAEAAADQLRRRWPGLIIGVQHGYFDHDPRGAANREVLDTVNAFGADVIFVGLGMPLQERWIALNYDRLERGVVFSVGGAFDYEAGVQVTPPRWTGRLGVEWLFRFISQPRRLFARYFVEPWSLIGEARRDVLGGPVGVRAQPASILKRRIAALASPDLASADMGVGSL